MAPPATPASPASGPTFVPPAGPAAVPTPKMSDVKRQVSVKKVRQIIFYLLTVLETLFALRFLFKLLTAQTQSPLVRWIFEISDPFLNPFVGIIRDAGRGGHILEFTTLIGMGLYALLALIIIGLVRLFAPTAPTKVWEE